jgi:hypothetical protein
VRRAPPPADAATLSPLRATYMKRLFGIYRGSACVAALSASWLAAQTAGGFTSADVYALRGLGDVQVSPDGKHVAYAITRRDGPGSPRSETWIRDRRPAPNRGSAPTRPVRRHRAGHPTDNGSRSSGG